MGLWYLPGFKPRSWFGSSIWVLERVCAVWPEPTVGLGSGSGPYQKLGFSSRYSMVDPIETPPFSSLYVETPKHTSFVVLWTPLILHSRIFLKSHSRTIRRDLKKCCASDLSSVFTAIMLNMQAKYTWYKRLGWPTMKIKFPRLDIFVKRINKALQLLLGIG